MEYKRSSAKRKEKKKEEKRERKRERGGRKEKALESTRNCCIRGVGGLGRVVRLLRDSFPGEGRT